MKRDEALAILQSRGQAMNQSLTLAREARRELQARPQAPAEPQGWTNYKLAVRGEIARAKARNTRLRNKLRNQVKP